MAIEYLDKDDLTNITENRIDIVQTLARHGPQTPKEVADRIGKSPETVRNSLRRLRTRDWVEYTDRSTGRQQLADKGLTIGGIFEERLAVHNPCREGGA